MRSEYYAPCTLGLEAALEQELRDLGAGSIRPQRGGVAFTGDRRLGYAANLWLRTAIRVQEELFQGKARDDSELYRLIQRMDWQRYLSNDHTLAVDATVRDSGITHSKFAALRVKDAIVDQMRDRTGARPSVDVTAPDLPLKVVVIRNRVTVYRNLSGTSLHKRGWRPIQVKSPLSECLAAGLLILSGWDRKSALIDPMCGSGTFLVEAACMASGRAPGRMRMFAFETWPDFDPAMWDELRAAAERGIVRDLPFPIAGADRHEGAISLARKSVAAAEVEDLVEVEVEDVSHWAPRVPPACVVVNPPYGHRLGSGEDLEDSWRSLGRFLRERCGGAAAWVLSGERELTQHLGLRSTARLPVMNGGIDCRWIEYRIDA